jgi:serine/threonine protein kinase
MALEGRYEIDRELGRGGMGVVYLGRDLGLDRPVAIKVLPDHLADDPERLARFEREAKLLATLNHPNIAGIYGIEESDGRHYLILEYVEGETLADRLERSALSVKESLRICHRIAAGVEAAHEKGVIHRDLKPGNVRITPDDEIKVLDFGLAKGAVKDESSSGKADSPTLTLQQATGDGVILGTTSYLSPEQARGKAVNRRADIWAFGCILYECLAGEESFEGETTSDTIARILEREVDLSALPEKTPPRVRELIQRCLEKDEKNRVQKQGLYKTCCAIASGIHTLSDCHHNTFRYIEGWIHGIGTGRLGIPTRKAQSEKQRLGHMLFGYALGLDRWLMRVPLQFLLLDLGHIDLGFDPRNNILRVYACLGEEVTAVKEWLAACLWYNLVQNQQGGLIGSFASSHTDLIQQCKDKGITVDEWMNSALGKDS